MELLLGDNPFFGIDHLSQDRARKRMRILTGYEKISDIMKFVAELGVRGFVVSTHPQLKHLVKHMETKTNLLELYDFYPILPYAQGYVSKVTEKGVINAMTEILSIGSNRLGLKILFKGSTAYLSKDFEKLLQTLIDVELLPLKSVKKKVIFLHDVVTDLAISLGMKKPIGTFMQHIEDQYNLEPGLVTKNFPKLIRKLEEWNVKTPTIMTSFNPIGYQMNPSKEECEKFISNNKVIAMNVLAGGYLKPQESFQYLSQLNLKAVTIGMSTKEHAQDTIDSFKKFIN